MIRNAFMFLLCLLATGTAAADGFLGNHPRGSTSQIVNIPLYDQDTPDSCPSADLTNATSDLQIRVFDNVRGYDETFTGAEIESVASAGTYDAPSASTSIGFVVSKAGSCWYEMHLHNDAFDEDNAADRLMFEVSDNSGEIMDATGWADMTGVNDDVFIASLLAASLTGYNTAGTVGAALGVTIPAINTAAVTTLDDKLDSVLEDTSSTLPAAINGIEVSAGSTRPRARLAPQE